MDVQHHHIGGSQVVLLSLDHHDLFVQRTELTEIHTSLLSVEVLELTFLSLEEPTCTR